MTQPSRVPLREVRQLAASVAAAEDQALLRLVRLLDSLPERGEADRVLEPARPRLQALRPERPLRFPRLLFLPLDGAIVPPTAWRRGGHTVPRSAIAPIAAAVEAALGRLAADIAAQAADADTGDAARIVALGGRLWPAAAEALPAAPPPGWAEAGLTRDDLAALRDLMRPVLAAGPAIQAAVHAAAQGPPWDLARAALVGPAAAGPLPLAAAIATLLRRATAPGGVLMVASEFGSAARAIGSRMVDTALEHLPDVAGAELDDAADAAARFFASTADLARSGMLDPERQRRLSALQHAMDETCRRRVTQAGAEQVVGVLATLADSAQVTDEAIMAVEQDARAIRALAQVGRSVGDPAVYDRALRGMAAEIGAVRTAPPGAVGPDGLTAIDLARVVEILAGPDAAEAMLRQAARG
jgi:hypothetical protein